MEVNNKTSVKKGISIITIVLNQKYLIEETIKSVISQKIDVNVEYIIIDGGSKDGTVEIIDSYMKHIDHFVSEPDGGIYQAINKGIQLASNDFIGLIHCGDFYEPGALRIVYNEFQKTSTDVIYGDIKTIEEHAQHTLQYYSSPNHNLLLKKMSIFHPATFVRRACYIKYGLYNTDYKICSDYEFFLLLFLKKTNFQYVPKVLANFRAGGISSTKPKLRFIENYQIRKKHLGIKKALKYIITITLIHTFFTFRKSCIEFIIGKQNFIKLKFYILNRRISIRNKF